MIVGSLVLAIFSIAPGCLRVKPGLRPGTVLASSSFAATSSLCRSFLRNKTIPKLATHASLFLLQSEALCAMHAIRDIAAAKAG
jgi:hypothetical protein